MDAETESRLLHAIDNLAAFHRDHEKFYASDPRERAVVLQRHARTLMSLAEHWSAAAPVVSAPFSPFEGAPDLTDPTALQLDGVLFMEGEGEPAEMARLRRDLGATADDVAATGEWLANAMEASWGVAASLLEIPALADLLGERHRIIANDWQAAGMSALAGRILARSVEVLDRVDFTPAALRADLAAERSAPRYLFSVAEMVGRAADLLSDSAGLVHDNERRWRVFRARAQELATARRI